MSRLTLVVPIALLAVACGGCGWSSDHDSEPLATRTSAPIAFLRDFGSDEVGTRNKLVIVNPDGSNERTVQLPPGYGVESFSWSLDGRRLVFPAIPPEDYRPFLYVVNADGSGLRKLMRLRDHSSSPVWSPRGDKIAFDMHDDGYHAVWVINPDGSGARRLTPGIHFSNPAWSPDGTKIAYSPYEGRGSGFWVVNVDGSGRKRLPPGARPDWVKQAPAITAGKEWENPEDGTSDYVVGPDERTVALNGPILPGGDWELGTFLIGQGNVQRLTDNDREDVAPSFSPDSKSLAFSGFQPPVGADDPIPPGDIYVINADGSGERNLTDSAANESSPDWAPRG
jgi:Tol biopolymer transport system component